MKKAICKTLVCCRVPYGKKSTPLEDREYKISPNSPVGTVDEIIKHIIIPQEYTRLVVSDHDGLFSIDLNTKERRAI